MSRCVFHFSFTKKNATVAVIYWLKNPCIDNLGSLVHLFPATPIGFYVSSMYNINENQIMPPILMSLAEVDNM